MPLPAADGPPMPVPLDGELGMAQTPIELRNEPGGLTLLLEPASALSRPTVAPLEVIARAG